MEGKYLKRTMLRFLMYFSTFFMVNILADLIFKPNINVVTSFSVALGVAAGIAAYEHYSRKKSEQK